MNKLSLAVLLFPAILFLNGCEDYPHHEPCLQTSDLQKSGPGPYGGESTPASPATQKSDAGKL